LYHHAGKIVSGLTVFVNLRSYPAVLILTAYGIGLTKAKRWKTLHQLFSAVLALEHREPQRVVSTLFLWSWAGGEQQLWQNLEGLEKRKTPLSDHLLEVMTEWKKSLVGVDGDFELLFERFEMMGALNRPGNRGGCLVKVKPPQQRVLQAPDSTVVRPRRVGCRQSIPAAADD